MTYETEAHALAEERVAMMFAAWGKAQQLKIGAGEIKPRVDRLLHRAGVVVAFFEVKIRTIKFAEFGTFNISQRKIEDLRKLHALVQVPVFLVVEFAGAALYYLNVNTEYGPIEDWGRDDRGDPADREPGACFDWSVFKPVRVGRNDLYDQTCSFCGAYATRTVDNGETWQCEKHDLAKRGERREE